MYTYMYIYIYVWVTKKKELKGTVAVDSSIQTTSRQNYRLALPLLSPETLSS